MQKYTATELMIGYDNAGFCEPVYKSGEVEAALAAKDQRVADQTSMIEDQARRVLDLRLKCQQKDARIAELEQAIKAHNRDLIDECAARPVGHCEPYTSRGRNCPDCPKGNRITMP